jgi:prevent-host-death family protein
MKGSDENVATPGELYGHLGEILGKVRWGGKLFTIQKHGRPMARLVSAEKVQPGRDGKRRFPRGDYVQVTPGQFRSGMSDLLAQVRFGNKNVLITYRGKVVAIMRPMGENA